jgi:hypothetical protein
MSFAVLAQAMPGASSNARKTMRPRVDSRRRQLGPFLGPHERFTIMRHVRGSASGIKRSIGRRCTKPRAALFKRRRSAYQGRVHGRRDRLARRTSTALLAHCVGSRMWVCGWGWTVSHTGCPLRAHYRRARRRCRVRIVLSPGSSSCACDPPRCVSALASCACGSINSRALDKSRTIEPLGSREVYVIVRTMRLRTEQVVGPSDCSMRARSPRQADSRGPRRLCGCRVAKCLRAS